MPDYKFLIRRGTSAEWSTRNPVLSDGEPGYERNTGKFKIGDGVKRWTELEYFVPGAGSPGISLQDLLAHVNDPEPHPIYDDGPSLLLLYQNSKV